MGAFSNTPGGIYQQLPAAVAQGRPRVDAAAIEGQHFLQDLDFKRDVIAHPYIICKTREEIKNGMPAF